MNKIAHKSFSEAELSLPISVGQFFQRVAAFDEKSVRQFATIAGDPTPPPSRPESR